MLSTKMSLGAIAALALASGANALAMDLTVDTFNGQVLSSGKSAFIKFYAPWYVRAFRIFARNCFRFNFSRFRVDAFSRRARGMVNTRTCDLDVSIESCQRLVAF